MARSGLHRDKWERADYRQRTIAKALHRDAVYEPAGITSQQSDCSGESADNTDVADSQGETGSAILDDVEAFLARYVAYPSEHARVAHALWIAHTHLMDVWDSTPRTGVPLARSRPRARRGAWKSASSWCRDRWKRSTSRRPTSSARSMTRTGSRRSSLTRSIPSLGRRRASTKTCAACSTPATARAPSPAAASCAARPWRRSSIPAYCAVAMAGLGDLPDTILTRSVVIRMRRRAESEQVEPFRRRVAHHQRAMRSGTGWPRGLLASTRQLGGVWPEMPAGVEDRDADVWEALLAVADAAGGDVARARPCGRRGTRRAVQGEHAKPRHPAPGRPAHGVQGPGRDDHRRRPVGAAASCPRRHGLNSSPASPSTRAGSPSAWASTASSRRTSALGRRSSRGYAREDLADAWERYLPPADGADTEGTNRRRAGDAASPSPRESATSATSATASQQWGIAQRARIRAATPILAPSRPRVQAAVAVVDVTRAFRYITPTR